MAATENKFKEIKGQKALKERKLPMAGSKVRAARKWIHIFNVFRFIDKGILLRIMPFIFFLTVLGIFYIANSYVSEKAIREIDKTSKDIKDLRSEYITVKSELMFKSRQSEVSKSVLPLGIKHLIVPPKKIIVKKNNSPNSELLTAN